jgi:hypothetical protein
VAINTSKVIAAEERRSQALQLKVAGATYAQIADQTGVSIAQAYKDIRKRLGEVRKGDRETVEQEWLLQMTRLERMLLRWWPLATGADDDKAELGTNQCLKIMGQMNKIGGLEPDKPLIQFNEFTQINNGMVTMADLLKEATNGTVGTVVEGTTNGNSD